MIIKKEKSGAGASGTFEKKQGGNRLKVGLMSRALFVLVMVLIILAVVTMRDRTSYSSYAVDEDSVTVKTDNVSTYKSVGNYILRYSSDGASLLEKNLTGRWNVTYDIDAPCSDECGTTVVIYDHNGTQVEIFDKNGSIGSFKTSSPIIKARVSEAGNVAVLLSESDASVIRYYTASGSEIAAVSSTLKTNGYPLDFDLSPDGLYLMAAFAEIEGTSIGSRVNFYDFSSTGASRQENLAASELFESTVVPEVYYLDDQTSVVIMDNGYAVYKGKEPALSKKVTFEESIISLVHDDDCLGFVFENENSDEPYVLKIYELSGNLRASVTVGISYDRITMGNDQIILNNDNELAIYSVRGNVRFEGTLDEGNIAYCLRTGNNRYLLVTNAKTETIHLK